MTDPAHQPSSVARPPGDPGLSDELPQGSAQAIKSGQPAKPDGDGDSPPLGHPQAPPPVSYTTPALPGGAPE